MLPQIIVGSNGDKPSLTYYKELDIIWIVNTDCVV